MRQKGFAPVLVLLILAIGALAFLGIKHLISTNQFPINLPGASTTPSPTQISTTDWRTYSNTKYGFSIKYPQTLDLRPTEFDQKKARRDYVNKCESGEIEGCGGGRWPDFLINFILPNNNTLFSVGIYQLPVKSSGLADVENDNFSYSVRLNPDEVDKLKSDEKEMTKQISSTLSFVAPDMPLSCLWLPDFGPGFDPIKDKDYIEQNIQNLVKLHGFYYLATSNVCKEITFYTWEGQEKTDAPPFTTSTECVLKCRI